MAQADISSIAPFFIVRDVAAALAFYRDQLCFEVTFQGPSDDDLFFGMVQRGGAMLLPAKFSAGWRASVPLTAGLTRQAMLPFVAWSVVAAVVWAGVLLTPRLIARTFGY